MTAGIPKLGLPEIDEQHQHFFMLIEDLESGSTPRNVALALVELEDYASYHFDNEERLMEQHALPSRQEHLAEHRDFRRRLDEFVGRLSVLDRRDIGPLLLFLREWLNHHILGTDARMAGELRAAGVVAALPDEDGRTAS